MKKMIIILSLTSVSFLSKGQGLKYSHAYLGAVLQDSRPGGSLILSYGIKKYVGIGAGVDLLSYHPKGAKESKFFAPFYADLRIKYPVGIFEPFVNGQFGKPAYESIKGAYTDLTGAYVQDVSENGKYFYGIGGGISIKKDHMLGLFVSATYRGYYFNSSPKYFEINGRKIDLSRSQGMVIISIGVVF